MIYPAVLGQDQTIHCLVTMDRFLTACAPTINVFRDVRLGDKHDPGEPGPAPWIVPSRRAGTIKR